ncbi:hypothetical protein P3T23_009362 [Paraburkholderia sp. GAS448]|uniref:hypothetical protein n=1 Tax=Paraburkholderia sp. GAS448 TaxID=3035136 RepID=UPI003D1C4B72
MTVRLVLNEQTFRAVLDCVVPDAAMNTVFAELPTRFVFNPWLGMGKGGMREVSVSERINSAPSVGI